MTLVRILKLLGLVMLASRHRKPSSGCDMFWQDGSRLDIPGCGKFGRGLDSSDGCVPWRT